MKNKLSWIWGLILEKFTLFFYGFVLLLVFVGYPIVGVAWMSNRPLTRFFPAVVAEQEIPAFYCIKTADLREENHPMQVGNQVFSRVDRVSGSLTLNRILPDQIIHQNEVMVLENCESYRLLFLPGKTNAVTGHNPGSDLSLLGFRETVPTPTETFSAILVVENASGYLVAVPEEKVSGLVEYLAPANRLMILWEVEQSTH